MRTSCHRITLGLVLSTPLAVAASTSGGAEPAGDRGAASHRVPWSDDSPGARPGGLEGGGQTVVSVDGPSHLAAAPGAPGAASADASWDPRFAPAGTAAPVRALLAVGSDLYVAGDFVAAGGIAARHVAKWDGVAWSALGAGTDAPAVSLAWDGTRLFAGGFFRTAGGVPASGVAAWDGAAWSDVGGGLVGAPTAVRALEWDGANLFAAGNIVTAGGVSVSNIARWDGASWNAMGTGLDDVAFDLHWDGVALYAGGRFLTAGGVICNHVARWDGSSWSSLGSVIYAGTSDDVYALASGGGSLFVGGNFHAAGGTALDNVARWDGTAWSALGSGVDWTVTDLAWDGSDLYVSGAFATAGGVAAGGIAAWDGASFRSLGSGVDNEIQTMALLGNGIFVGGQFAVAGGGAAHNLAHWDGTAWSPIESGPAHGVIDALYALAWDGSNLYAGGELHAAGGEVAGRVASWDGARWTPLGAGMGNATRRIHALAWSAGQLYAAELLGVSRWDGSAWTMLGSGMGGSSPAVLALACDGGDVYAGGRFVSAGGAPANGIARWDGSAWRSLGSGVAGAAPSVYALVWDGQHLYAGGSFSSAGGVPAGGIARWDGASWSSLGAGVQGTRPVVYALAWDGQHLYAGGSFSGAGGVAASCVARWDGSSWSELGSGVGGSWPAVYALAWDAGSLYVGGRFDWAGGVSASRVARWDGSVWSPLGSGIGFEGVESFGTSAVVAMVATGAGSASDLYVGGLFQTAGARPSRSIARWDGPSEDLLVGQGLGEPSPNRVRVFRPDGSAAPVDFLAYGAGHWGVNVAASGIFGATEEQILTGPGPGAVYGPQVRAFDRRGTPISRINFFAYGTLKLGVNVAGGDLDSGGDEEMLSGAGPGVIFGPHVRGWDVAAAGIVSVGKVNFYAYATLRYGVNVASGALDADAHAELLSGAGPGPTFAAHVRGWNYDGAALGAIGKINYVAFGGSTSGVNVAAGDVDDDGYDEIAVAPGPAASSPSRFLGHDYDGTAISPLQGFDVVAFPTGHGARVGVGAVDADGAEDLLAGGGRTVAADATVRPYAYRGGALAPLASFDAFPGGGHGVNVDGGDFAY